MPASGPTLSGRASAKNTDFSIPAWSHSAPAREDGTVDGAIGPALDRADAD
jgi:hypothetical protein